MRSLKIGFSCSTKKFAPFSKALIWWDHVPYSHVYFQFENRRNPDIPLIYQASGTMLNFMAVPVFLSHSRVIEEFEIFVSDELYNDIMRACMSNAGKPYGVLQVVGIAIADVFHLRSNPFSNKEDKFVCSEWVAEQIEKLGYKFDKDLDLVKPIDVHRAITEGLPKAL